MGKMSKEPAKRARRFPAILGTVSFAWGDDHIIDRPSGTELKPT